jgi:hypothetical protein
MIPETAPSFDKTNSRYLCSRSLSATEKPLIQEKQMRLKLQFIIVAFIGLVIYIPAVQAQAKLTFSGGNGTPLQITLQQSVSYTIINSNCGGAGNGPIFLFDEVGNLLSSSFREVTGTISSSINSGTPQLIDGAQTGGNVNDVTMNDLRLFSSARPGVSSGNTVVLSAGTVITTGFNFAGAPPAGGNYNTFITNSVGIRCSNIVSAPTAATVSISGRVITAAGRSVTNVRLSLTDSQGNVRTETTDSSGYYQFNDVQVGETYILTASGKHYSFSQPSQFLNVNDEITEINFIANSKKRLRIF